MKRSGSEDVFLDYRIPPGQVAQRAGRRGASRLMVVDRRTGEIEDRRFRDLERRLRPGDLLFLNDTRVVRARVTARKKETGGRLELLFLDWSGERWRAMVKGSVREGAVLEVAGWPGPLKVAAARDRFVELESPAPGDPLAFFERVGRTPLPPYIHRRGGELEDADRRRYQTVYARLHGSVAAPTAGLHFTRRTISRIKAGGVEVASGTLHVGWGTFSPLPEDWASHRLEPEWKVLAPAAAAAVNGALGQGRRVVAVGTTAVRLLESSWDPKSGSVRPGEGEVDLFIRPGYRFNVVGALVTNFHRPKSSLLLLVDAFAGSGLMRRAYGEALGLGYRFFSYGDAMCIV